jgi:hypothetical protein
MKWFNKRNVAKAIGAGAVGLGTAFVLKELVGRAGEESAAAAVVMILAHEAFNAPVSNWVYKQL